MLYNCRRGGGWCLRDFFACSTYWSRVRDARARGVVGEGGQEASRVKSDGQRGGARPRLMGKTRVVTNMSVRVRDSQQKENDGTNGGAQHDVYARGGGDGTYDGPQGAKSSE